MLHSKLEGAKFHLFLLVYKIPFVNFEPLSNRLKIAKDK